jgi:hypothetical protein
MIHFLPNSSYVVQPSIVSFQRDDGRSGNARHCAVLYRIADNTALAVGG